MSNPNPWTPSTHEYDGMVATRIAVAGLGANVNLYEHDEHGTWGDANVHGVERITVRDGTSSTNVSISVTNDRGIMFTLSLYGISLATLASAVEAAQRDEVTA